MITFTFVLASYFSETRDSHVLKALSPGHGPLWSPLSKFGALKACFPVTTWNQRYRDHVLPVTHTINGCGHWVKEQTLLLQTKEVLMYIFRTQTIAMGEFGKVFSGRERVYKIAGKERQGKRPN
jgi:hypothetical protein